MTASRTIGKYHLLAELGEGGMAEVYLALAGQSKGFHRLFVIKILRAAHRGDPDLVAMFLDEARLAARLYHPNIVQTNEVGEADGVPYIAMEYLDGMPLSAVLKNLRRRKERLGRGCAVRIVSEVLAGLAYAHDLREYDDTPLGIVHRDISPHNIMITYHGQVKIVDFGIAKAAVRSVHTATGILKGKVAYMSPEQAQGGDVDGRTDVFALGAVLYEALTGSSVWQGRGDVEILRMLLAEDVHGSPKKVADDVPDALDRICTRALAPTVGERYASASEMLADLGALPESEVPPATTAQTGEFLSALFQNERAQIGRSIQAQIAAFESLSKPEFGGRAMPRLGQIGEGTPPGAAATPYDGGLTPTRLEGVGSRRKERLALVAGGAALVIGGFLAFRPGRPPAASHVSLPVSPSTAAEVPPAPPAASHIEAEPQVPTPPPPAVSAVVAPPPAAPRITQPAGLDAGTKRPKSLPTIATSSVSAPAPANSVDRSHAMDDRK